MRDHKQNEIANYVAFREREREGRGREERGGEREKRREEGNGSDGRSGDQTYHANELEQQSRAVP